MGDPACWLGAVCLSCGRVVESNESGACPVCGWAFPEEPEAGHVDKRSHLDQIDPPPRSGR